ncbi:MAG: hypothetical protein BWX88_02637 [Planctomycetes bacterium ADurb.Bin126]|nr:MAG: hypothetical protein BWX88_02637 [Planctomycetes bacterium ADurb.Bin126]HOD83167.1 ACT domain-containing protein [Phycisphaerae bacterium]HQL74066.1 ACT domain-containing protein [Phycisphaerae bacterium]
MSTLYNHAYVLNVISDDHPGIIAAVGSAVDSLHGNIDSCSQTVLEGYFTLIMIVSFREPTDPEALSDRVRAAAGDPHYQVVALPFDNDLARQGRERTEKFVITAFGPDKPGIVLRFSQYLAGRDINIVDLYGDRKGDDFVLIAQAEVPARWDFRTLQADLEELGRTEGFTVRLQHENIFVATNQMRLPR